MSLTNISRAERGAQSFSSIRESILKRLPVTCCIYKDLIHSESVQIHSNSKTHCFRCCSNMKSARNWLTTLTLFTAPIPPGITKVFWNVFQYMFALIQRADELPDDHIGTVLSAARKVPPELGNRPNKCRSDSGLELWLNFWKIYSWNFQPNDDSCIGGQNWMI